MPITYEPIASTTLGTATSSVTFSSISQTYTDLILVGNITMTAHSDYWWRFNSDTGTNYSNVQIRANGTTVDQPRGNNQTIGYVNTYASTNLNNIFTMNIFNYSNTTTFKTVLTRYNNASAATNLRVSLWRSTAAISNILIQSDISTFASGSTFTLYGIQAA
jgi:hypothetical protein